MDIAYILYSMKRKVSIFETKSLFTCMGNKKIHLKIGSFLLEMEK